MLEQVLTHLHNWFRVQDNLNGIHHGKYTIQNSGVTLPFLQNGQYYRIMGSLFNDGLHRYGEQSDKLTDETFDGTIWALAVPKAVVDLANEIATWQEKNGAASMGLYSSESFGNYSYTKATDAVSGGAVTWESVFRLRLNQWRKLREL